MKIIDRTGEKRDEDVGPGDVIGDYRIESLLGRGGMGSVFRATQLSLRRSVAIKILLPEHAARRGAAERFAREAKVTAALRHPNAVEVFELGSQDGKLYLAMELLHGTTLRSEAGDGRLVSVERTIALSAKIVEVLVAAHAQGIVHRDLKPENVFLEQQADGTERVVVVDFGLAFVIGDEELGRMTREGMITGTPDYIAPEQAVGGEVGPAADVYALGCMMFEMLVGITPFHGNPMRVIMQQTHGIVPTFAEVRRDVVVPRALEALVMSMLAKSPAARPTAAELRSELAAMLHGTVTAERARERVGLDGRAARMVSEIRPPTSRATTLQDDGAGEAEVAVVGTLEGELVMALSMNGLRLFIVSPEQPIAGASAIYAPGADLGALAALRAAHPKTPIVTSASPQDAERVPALLRAGIDDVVMTPVRAEDLGRRLWKLVRKARHAAQRGDKRS